ncbi:MULTISPECIES: SDR family NAD(P)-dependent oxidoreductase [Streptomyces]|uniref:SDR family NAD(P)-dependent oxidoreductase n=1 Tax=Streptomyces TaxID=1883 RepID=UPI0006AE71F9|nr:SDR family NAD(P)-dependent oxidoreductase [Streptomyces sp. NRRL F-4707]KOX34602.1 short-chain dehydrogenase [Streptomyces sp. NRRL F-4707]
MSNGTQSLAGKVAVVTGGAGGIGVATVEALAVAGAQVVLADVADDTAKAAAEKLAAQGLSVVGHGVDISSEASVERLVDFAVDTFGGIDVLDNNAALTSAIRQDRDVVSMSVELWDQVLAVNLRGPMLLCKHTVPVMIERGGGSVVNITSGQGLSGDRVMVAYGSSKGGLIALTRFVAAAYGSDGIRCNAVAPGLVRTPALEADMPVPVQQMFQSANLIPRLGTPQDVSQLVAFLASPAASFITGQVLSVDGGFLAHLPTLSPLPPR